MNIYMVRHGETDWNVGRRWQGISDIPLNANGIRQAHMAAEKFAGMQVKIGTVYTSPLTRARKTAETIADKLGAGLVEVSDLREICVGAWEGMDVSSIISQPEYEAWEEGKAQSPGGESKQQVLKRVLAAISQIAAAESGDFVIVAHSLVIRVFVCNILMAPLGVWRSFSIDNCAVSTIGYDKSTGLFKIITLNDRLA